MTVVPTTLNRTCAFTGLKALGLAALFCAAMQPAFAQSESSWSNQGLIYLLGPTLDGTSGIGPIDTDVDMSASDVFETLDGAFLGMYRGEGERWGVMIDVVYMDLKGRRLGRRRRALRRSRGRANHCHCVGDLPALTHNSADGGSAL
jgi:hypothetical protein